MPRSSASKKSVAAGERDPDVARRRAQWTKYQDRVEAERLVFIDETWTKTNMAPLRGWAPRGERQLSRSGVFEAFFQMLAECSQTAHLIQFFDSTTARAHVSAAGAKATVLAVKRRFAFLWSDMPRDASRLARCATAFGGFGLDPP